MPAATNFAVNAPRKRATFRFGHALLQVETSTEDLLDAIRATYEECTEDASEDPRRVFCVVQKLDRGQIVRFDFLAGAPSDCAATALALLHPPPGASRYTIEPSGTPGWRLIGSPGATLIATSAGCVIADLDRTGEEFVADYLVAATLAVQRDLIVLHAAAVNAGGSGVLLIGASRAGKTTTALHLAAHGHALLGDELGLVDMSRRHLLPLRRAFRLRAGPRERPLADALRRAGIVDAADSRSTTGPLRIDRLFPKMTPVPAPLHAIFYLHAFDTAPAIEQFHPSFDDTKLFQAMSANDIALISWGLNPAGRALRLLALRHTLTQVPCWRMTVGSPAATARLIERTLENL